MHHHASATYWPEPLGPHACPGLRWFGALHPQSMVLGCGSNAQHRHDLARFASIDNGTTSSLWWRVCRTFAWPISYLTCRAVHACKTSTSNSHMIRQFGIPPGYLLSGGPCTSCKLTPFRFRCLISGERVVSFRMSQLISCCRQATTQFLESFSTVLRSAVRGDLF